MSQPFYLIVVDRDRGVFAVEGPMTDDRPWNEAARVARNDQRCITCGPSGTDRDDLPLNTDASTNSPAFRQAAS
jgi:hypothetical protein